MAEETRARPRQGETSGSATAPLRAGDINAGQGAKLAALRHLIAETHAGENEIDDAALDAAIGLRIHETEDRLSFVDLVMKHGHHRVYSGDSSYVLVRQMWRWLRTDSSFPVVELGSGYGRVALYGGLLANARVCAIEIVPERVAEAQRVRDMLGLDTLDFRCADVVAAQWPESDQFCFINSVLPSHLPIVVHRLENAARTRSVSIVSASTAARVLADQPWLEEIAQSSDPIRAFRLRLFTSRW